MARFFFSTRAVRGAKWPLQRTGRSAESRSDFGEHHRFEGRFEGAKRTEEQELGGEDFFGGGAGRRRWLRSRTEISERRGSSTIFRRDGMGRTGRTCFVVALGRKPPPGEFQPRKKGQTRRRMFSGARREASKLGTGLGHT